MVVDAVLQHCVTVVEMLEEAVELGRAVTGVLRETCRDYQHTYMMIIGSSFQISQQASIGILMHWKN